MELGSEMHPGVLLGFRTLVMIAVAILLAVELKREGMTRHECAQSGLTLLGGLTFVFGLMFLRWVRAIDFLWPILILFIGLMLSVRPGLFGRTFERLQPRGVRVRPSIVHLLLCLLCLVVFAGVQGALVATDNQRPLASFLVALHDVPAGSRILNPDWHFFMPAVAVRSDLLYAGGMDPSFTYVDSPAAARRMAELISPADQSTVAPPDAKAWLEGMTALYPSQYLVLFTARHQAFIAALEAQTSLHNISEEPLIALFKLGAK